MSIRKRPEHFDVIIVGAGISGIGSAYHLHDQCPGKSYLVLEEMESFGGTWLTHTYPGVRSDSDLYTFGYRFKPWTKAPIATAEEILHYLGEVIFENDIDRHIRYNHHIVSASWSSKDKLWTLECKRLDDDTPIRFTTSFLWMCQGYYDHSKGYTPEWKGMEDFEGQIVHPQTWPDDIDLSGKRAVLIGSGATAATVAPAIADDCEHLTLLQRSPTYFLPEYNANDLADLLRNLKVEEAWIHEIVRRQILDKMAEFTHRSVEEPEVVREELLAGVRSFLGPDYDMETHFTPKYRPWQQRVAFVPEGDLFQGINKGQVTMVTDEIDRFTKNGILLKSGKELEADVIITATGFNLCVLGGIQFSVDGEPIDFAKTVTYRGMMFTGVPNMLWVFGYFRASWTLRVDIVGDFVCRLLNHMKTNHASSVEVALRPEDKDMEILPWIDEDNFNPGYLKRSMHLMPKRGSNPVWQHTQDYWSERDALPKVDLSGPEFVYR
jgi:cation diffusion facilitator CzcD-associated flavoprotein CzcO